MPKNKDKLSWAFAAAVVVECYVKKEEYREMPFLTNAIQIGSFYCSINNTMLWCVFAVSFLM